MWLEVESIEVERGVSLRCVCEIAWWNAEREHLIDGGGLGCHVVWTREEAGIHEALVLKVAQVGDTHLEASPGEWCDCSVSSLFDGEIREARVVDLRCGIYSEVSVDESKYVVGLQEKLDLSRGLK